MKHEIPDQIAMWNTKHGLGDHEGLRHTPSPLSLTAEPKFPRQSRILELGCGVGRDAVFFADKGHNVLATDSSEVVIKQDREHFPHSGVQFEVLDMQQPLPYLPASFDVVYANLALHYYPEEKTQGIIKNISKILKNDGVLAFACKSKDDIRTKDAQQVENNVFVAPNGHALHLFSISYTRQLLEGIFGITYIDEIAEEYNGRTSDIVRCIAKNIGQNRGEL